MKQNIWLQKEWEQESLFLTRVVIEGYDHKIKKTSPKEEQKIDFSNRTLKERKWKEKPKSPNIQMKGVSERQNRKHEEEEINPGQCGSVGWSIVW